MSLTDLDQGPRPTRESRITSRTEDLEDEYEDTFRIIVIRSDFCHGSWIATMEDSDGNTVWTGKPYGVASAAFVSAYAVRARVITEVAARRAEQEYDS